MNPQNNNKFGRLTIEGWRQFGIVEIDLHPQLTVLTGSNGAGKSTLLNIFSSHFDYTRPYLATPARDESGGYKYLTGMESFLRLLFPATKTNEHQVGELTYSNEAKAKAQVPQGQGIQYNLTLANMQAVNGFHVPSHRRLPNYQSVGQIPTRPMLPSEVYDHFNREMKSQFNGQHSGMSSTYRIKEALLAMVIFGAGNQYVEPNSVLLNAFEGFNETLRKILPEEIGFETISIRSPEVVLVTKSGDFLIDAASGGLAALIDLAWQIYMFSLRVPNFVVTIDEPENHLHPSMQRSLMGNLIKAFPAVQFIVATHSPFIVSALREARVYVLRHSEKTESGSSGPSRFVSSVRLDSINRAGTASKILMDVLGLQTTYPDWVTDGVEAIVQRFRGRSFNDELLTELRSDLESAGYTDLYPDAVATILKP